MGAGTLTAGTCKGRPFIKPSLNEALRPWCLLSYIRDRLDRMACVSLASFSSSVQNEHLINFCGHRLFSYLFFCMIEKNPASSVHRGRQFRLRLHRYRVSRCPWTISGSPAPRRANEDNESAPMRPMRNLHIVSPNEGQ